MRTDPETRFIDVGYVDPIDRYEWERARDEYDHERADRRRDAREDARNDQKEHEQ